MSDCHGLVDSHPYKNKKRVAMECNVQSFTILVILKKSHYYSNAVSSATEKNPHWSHIRDHD